MQWKDLITWGQFYAQLLGDGFGDHLRPILNTFTRSEHNNFTHVSFLSRSRWLPCGMFGNEIFCVGTRFIARERVTIARERVTIARERDLLRGNELLHT